MEYPVAVLTTTFKATPIDAGTVRCSATGTESTPVAFALRDVDNDGDSDMLLHFRIKETGISCGDRFAVLAGETMSGQNISGADSIVTVGRKRR